MSDPGTVGEAQPTSVSTPVTYPTAADIVNAGIAKGGGWFGSGGITSGLLSFAADPALVIIGVVLAVGALLISQKQTVVQLASKVPP